MKNFPEPVGLETDISLQDGNKSEISNWERDVRRWGKNRKKLVFFEQLYLDFSTTGRVSVPKFLIWVYLKGEFEHDVLQTLHTRVQ